MRDEEQRQETGPAGLLTRIGPLRTALMVFVLSCLPMVFFANDGQEGWRVVPTHIAPVLVVIFIWLLLFDILMSRVMIADKPAAERPRYRLAYRVDLALLAALVLFWGPFFYATLKG